MVAIALASNLASMWEQQGCHKLVPNSPNGRAILVRIPGDNHTAGLAVIAVYGPISSARQRDRDDFLDQIRRAKRGVGSRDILIVGGDFNADFDTQREALTRRYTRGGEGMQVFALNKELGIRDERLKQRVAAGVDGFLAEFYKYGSQLLVKQINGIVREMWRYAVQAPNGLEANAWPESWNEGLVVPLWKRKGNKADKSTWRGVTLLSVGSKLLARVVAQRTLKWSDPWLHEAQAGFRKGRGVDDVLQVTRRIVEEATACQADESVVLIRLFDIEKAYPRVSRDTLWMLLQRSAPVLEGRVRRERVEAQGSELATLRRRVDRLEKSTHLVLENSERVEALFAKAEASREFKNLASETAMAILRELHVLTNLPVPLPEVPPETWHASSGTNANVDIDATLSWWSWAPALLASSRFVAPNKTRSKRDETTGEWRRASGHFVIRLEFGEASLRVQQGLQGALGQWIGKAVKSAREEGKTPFNLYLDKTPEELERKRKRTGGEMGTTSAGRGGGKGKDRKKGKGKGGKGGASRGGGGAGRREEK
ncbi:hypothetical protein AK812_SmicGene13709 [Symbiodinium microadriaticum]|uniref:Uncharacterized protein n=1 Tax=Symbiodinium microadriaticum TaxID=2951 RepID=A0A1Q9E7J9_SYMMI|nr:hypothetical protein AK812_SmicGene13709 [Symbiodinium microadriaticum]CAE7901000.1 unnamed protein product [Symbiodinium sp. KB8]